MQKKELNRLMEHFENYFKGVQGTKLFFQAWIPKNPPKAIIQIIHGYSEHSGRYLNVVNALIPRSYAIFISDHRGHGKSEGLKAYVKSFNHFVEDQKRFYDLIRTKHPTLPLFVLGHSMGSVIARLFVAQYPEGIDGLILSGAGTKIGSMSPFFKFVADILFIFLPKMRIAMDTADYLSHDPEVVRSYREDDLVFKKSTVQLGVEFIKGLRKSIRLSKRIQIPTLVQAGSKDKLLTHAKRNAELLIMKDKTIKIYEGLYHEVYNELETERGVVLTDLGNWLDSHL